MGAALIYVGLQTTPKVYEGGGGGGPQPPSSPASRGSPSLLGSEGCTQFLLPKVLYSSSEWAHARRLCGHTCIHQQGLPLHKTLHTGTTQCVCVH